MSGLVVGQGAGEETRVGEGAASQSLSFFLCNCAHAGAQLGPASSHVAVPMQVHS